MQHLTPREVEVIKLAAQGNMRKQIAAKLKIKTGTINSHFKSIYIKLGVRSMVELTIWAVKHGYA